MYRGEPVGFFPYIILESDFCYPALVGLCQGYYTERSASKPITNTYQRLINLANENPSLDKTADQIIGNMIRDKFINKWNRIYQALVTSTYNPLEEYDYNETKTGNNQDKTNYNSNIENNGKVGSKETTTTTTTTENNVLGFNSTVAVGQSEVKDSENVTTIGLEDDNTNYNKQQKTGIDTTDYKIDETITKSGRDKNSAYLLERELSFRDKYVFFDIVYKDIDSIVCLGVY